MTQDLTGSAPEAHPHARFPALDILRVSMMLLGIPFHTSVAYRGYAAPGYFSDPRGDWWWLFLMEVAHVFRMPAFYFLAGFFTAMQVANRGVSGMTRSRLMRVGVVWLVALALFSPVIHWVGVYNHFAANGPGAWDKTWAAIRTGPVDTSWLSSAPLHLWFLEYLLLFCLAGAAVSMAAARMPAFAAAAERAAGRLLMSRMRVPALSIPFCALLWTTTSGRLPYPDAFTPRMDLILAYGFFFGAGWLLYRRRELLPEVWSLRWYEILPGVAALAVNAFSFKLWADFREGAPAWRHAASVISGAVGAWAILFALLGLASKGVTRPSPRLQYFADSCYWTYLMHFPLALLFPALLADWAAPSLVKVTAICVCILAVMLSTYHLFVRRTFIGRLLHGPRQ